MPQATEPAVETIEHLDFEEEIPCNCTIATGEPADWVGRCWGCGYLIWACTPHLHLLERQVEESNGSAICLTCGNSGRTLADILHVMSLRGCHA